MYNNKYWSNNTETLYTFSSYFALTDILYMIEYVQYSRCIVHVVGLHTVRTRKTVCSNPFEKSNWICKPIWTRPNHRCVCNRVLNVTIPYPIFPMSDKSVNNFPSLDRADDFPYFKRVISPLLPPPPVDISTILLSLLHIDQLLHLPSTNGYSNVRASLLPSK